MYAKLHYINDIYASLRKKMHFHNKFVSNHNKIFVFYMYLCTQFAVKREFSTYVEPN